MKTAKQIYQIFSISLLILLLSITFAGFALAADESEVQFSFAQPPITKPIEEGEKSHRINLTYLRLDMDNAITGTGVNFMQKIGQERGGTSWNVGGFALKDDDGDMDGFMINGGAAQEITLDSKKHSIIFFGFTPSLMYMNFDSSTATADIEVEVTMLSFNLSGGYQHQIPVGRVQLTPYAKVEYIYNMTSTYTTIDTGSYYDTDTDDTTDSFMMQTIGFDIILPGGVSVASAFQTGADDDMTLIQVGWTF